MRMIISMTLLLGACSPSHVGLHADFVAAAGISAGAVDRGLNAVRSTALDRIVESAGGECGAPNVCDVDREVYWTDHLAEAERAWSPVLACRAPIPEALHAYTDALETAQLTADERLGLAHLLSRAARLAAIWERLAVCVDEALPEGETFDMPNLPPGLLIIVEGLTEGSE